MTIIAFLLAIVFHLQSLTVQLVLPTGDLGGKITFHSHFHYNIRFAWYCSYLNSLFCILITFIVYRLCEVQHWRRGFFYPEQMSKILCGKKLNSRQATLNIARFFDDLLT